MLLLRRASQKHGTRFAQWHEMALLGWGVARLVGPITFKSVSTADPTEIPLRFAEAWHPMLTLRSDHFIARA